MRKNYKKKSFFSDVVYHFKRLINFIKDIHV